MAEVGFVVSLEGEGRVLSPSLFSDAAARTFRLENDRFLCNKEAVDIYWNPKAASLEELDASLREVSKVKNPYPDKSGKMGGREKEGKANNPTEAEFRQVVADGKEGSIARFLQNQLKVLFWYRPSMDPNLVFGAQLNLSRLLQHLQSALELDPGLTNSVTVALLDDSDHPRLKSNPLFHGDWKHPFVISEVGQVLPHWQVGVFLNDPGTLAKSANIVQWTVGLLVALLLVAIAAGSWLIAADLRRQLALSRQKTDFVSNVSHELKTPLTSIRMFSELLAEGRVSEEGRRREYLGIIGAETARLTRLINNVLDFARLERGEKKYAFAACDFRMLVRETIESYRPQLESAGFKVSCELPGTPMELKCDRDALAQVLLNLISNAEKYSSGQKEIHVRLSAASRVAELEVMDRGIGVPAGCEERIFEQFFRAHDSLSSGIQGSGLGLTLARQIVRAHGGEISYHPRDGGGSSFRVVLPLE
jgi:signal transduction histidine kinase